MSAIHQALKKADRREHNPLSSEFNPLARPALKKTNPTLYYLLAISLFIAAGLLFFWPKTPAATTEAANQTNQPEIITAGVAETPPVEQVNNTAEEQTIHDSENTQLVIEPIIAPTKTVLAQAIVTEAPVAEVAEVETATSSVKAPNAQTENKPSQQNKSAKNSTEKPTIQPKSNTVKVNDASASTTPVKISHSEATQAEPTQLEQNNDIIRASASQWQQEVEQLITVGKIEQAESKLKSWISSQPKAATPRILLAKIYLNNGLYQAAEPVIATVDHPQAQALLGVIYERTQQPARAAEVFEQLFRANPQQHKWLLFWAINSENSGQLAKSATLYQNYLTVFSSQDANLTTFAQKRLQVVRGQ